MKYVLVLALFWSGPAATTVPEPFHTLRDCTEAGEKWQADIRPFVMSNPTPVFSCLPVPPREPPGSIRFTIPMPTEPTK